MGCFAARGYHDATMDDIVRASGLSKGSLYWHFRSKEEVFLAVFDRFGEEVFALLEREAAVERPVLETLRIGLGAYLEKILSEGPLLRAWAEFLAHPAARVRYAHIWRVSREGLGRLLRRGAERGELRADLSPEELAVSFVAGVEGLVLQAMVDEGFDARSHWPALWATLERGSRA